MKGKSEGVLEGSLEGVLDAVMIGLALSFRINTLVLVCTPRHTASFQSAIVPPWCVRKYPKETSEKHIGSETGTMQSAL